jgi:hypothetical protein
MALLPFSVEKSFRIFKENSESEFVDFLFGTAAPGGDAGEQDAAPIGSIFLLQDGSSSQIFQKKFNTAATTDWVAGASGAGLIFRGEKIRVLTNDTVVADAARDLVANPFADDEVPLITAADFNVGEFIIADADGTPLLLEVTNVSAPNVTFSTPDAGINPPLAEGDTFVAINYLPDSPGNQELQALVQKSTTVMVKIGDVNWNFADGINLNGYTEINGPVLGSDTVQVALEKHGGDITDHLAATGISRGDTDMGTYTGDIISDNIAQTGINQELEDAIESIARQFSGTVPQNTPTNVDSILVDEFQRCTWIVTARDTANPERVRSLEVNAIHNGHGAADATNSDRSISERINVGNVNLQIDIVLTGAAGTQAMNLELDTNEAGGIQYTVERVNFLPLAG